MMKHCWRFLVIVLWVGGAWPLLAKDSCLDCHGRLEGPLADPVRKFEVDVHRQHDLRCVDCHGGDASADDPAVAMSPARGFRGTPKKTQVPRFCARCHSNATYMHRFAPKARVDQLSQYLTSVHGKRLGQGDTQVASCVDCHSVHDIRAVADPRAPVYPLNVAQTCAHCHAHPAHMAKYGIPTDQVEKYQRSVHYQVLSQGDLSAPTCSTCHGNHGAVPPGVNSVGNVCGTCHVFFAQLFDKSPHQPAFAKMGLPGCTTCHSNHEILKPSDEMVGLGAKSVCITCHSAGDKGYKAAEHMAGEIARLETFMARSEDILGTAEQSGMEVSTARVQLAAAHEALIKARVQIHSFNPDEVAKLTKQGVEVAEKTYAAGVVALRERDFRRKGLGFSLIAIVVTIAGLFFKLRQIEAHSQDR